MSTPSTAKLAQDQAGIEHHYDKPVEFYKLFLDSRMTYSCAYFTHPDNPLEQAEADKLELVCRKLDLRPTDRVLDIGSGWGSFLFYAAENYGCRVTGITLSPTQARYVEAEAGRRGLSDRVSVQVVHVLAMPFEPASFDKIVTIGAIEHMDDLTAVFERCARVLKNEGWMLVHGMTVPEPAANTGSNANGGPSGIDARTAEAIESVLKAIFPVGGLTTLPSILRSLEVNGFAAMDVEEIGAHYDKTIQHWLNRLEEHEDEAIRLVGEEYYREYLACSAGFMEGFASDFINCYQVLARRTQKGRMRLPTPWTRERMLMEASRDAQ